MQDILGHADAETTMDIYAEATKDLKRSELINFEDYFNKQKQIQFGIIQVATLRPMCDRFATTYKDLRRFINREYKRNIEKQAYTEICRVTNKSVRFPDNEEFG